MTHEWMIYTFPKKPEGAAVFKDAVKGEIKENKDDLSYINQDVDLDRMKSNKPKPVQHVPVQTKIATPVKEVKVKDTKLDDDLFGLLGSKSAGSSALDFGNISDYIAQNAKQEDKGLFDF